MTARIAVLVIGRSGRMAQAVTREVSAAPDLMLAGILPGRQSTAESLALALAASPPGTIVCDFSRPTMLRTLLRAMENEPRRLVTGTSGLTADDAAALGRASDKIAIMKAHNFSLGAMMARMLIGSLARLSAYDPAWQAIVVDFHHAKKLDPESATARDFAAAWAEGSPGRITPISTIRLGDAISEHSLIAAGRGERLEIAHRLFSFDAPVAGALAAVRFLASRPPGLYGPDSLFAGTS